MGVEVKIIGAGAFLVPDGQDVGRPFMRDDKVTVDEAMADRLVNDGVAIKTAPAGGTLDIVRITEGYEKHKADLLQGEVDLRRADGRTVEVEGTGKDGNVLKDDLVLALLADDEAVKG